MKALKFTLTIFILFSIQANYTIADEHIDEFTKALTNGYDN